MDLPKTLPLWSPEDGITRVLVITAHPDDVDFGAAGSVAAFTKCGLEVAFCVITDGQAGGSDLSVSRAQMAQIRRQEQLAAASELSVSDVTFLGYPDGALSATIELRRDLTRVIRRFRPQRIIAPSPERDWNRLFASHPDHLAAGEAVVCAIYPDARNPFAHPELLTEEGLEPHVVPEMWLMVAPNSDIAVDITSTFDKKISALRCHASQGTRDDQLAARIRQWALASAQTAGLPEGSLIEAFRVVHTA